ncbi:MAG TPA: translation initiation factor IF-2 [Candidatus Paceibacterota bacterium]|nr:translation initiation factor IF-2 [Candidatus Paceibacterota bacterium]
MPQEAQKNTPAYRQAGAKSNLKPRPPVVVVLGHVDHGKTSLLDYIRKTNVAAREAGGITQSIGAYEITHDGKKVTFIDTPGHEAFSKMRSRGASIADLAILVVAAEEGVKPQTAESIKILQDSKTPFVVAITKIDKPGADVERVKGDLMNAGVMLEGYGGQVSYQPISSKTGEHIKELLDLVLLTAEVEELTYEPTLPAEGFILETRMDRRRGLEATAIVKNGTLRAGDELATETAHGRAKILENFLGETVKTLEPCAPALIIGFEKLPQVGEEFAVGPSVEIAKKNETEPAVRKPAPLLDPDEGGEALRLILKAADAGSLEALNEVVRNLPLEKPIHIVSHTVGDVVDNDVKLAISTKALILAFGTRIDKTAANLADINKVRIISSKIIYELLQAIEKQIIEGRVPAAGALEVLAVFNQGKLEKQVVGGKVTEGIFRNKAAFEIERAKAIIGRGRVQNIQQQKKDAGQVGEGNEAGVLLNSDIAIQKGDILIIR